MTFNRGFLFFSCLLLSACSQPETAVEKYVSRLANVLDVSIESHDARHTLAPQFPDRRDLIPTQAGATISVREFLSMRQCELHEVLATKNSLLGKLAEPSQALLIDLKILELGPNCVEQLRNDQQVLLAQKLEQALVTKQAGILTLLWRALLAESEHRAFWGISGAASEDYPQTINNDVVVAVEELSQFSERIQAGDYRSPANMSAILEQQLGILRDGDGGQLLKQFLLLLNGLEHANRIIKERLNRPLCLKPVPTSSARNLKNVVNLFFVGEVQPHAVALTQRYRQLIPVLQALEEPLLPHATEAYREWVAIRNALFEHSMAAPRDHVKQIQRLFSQCGLRAG